jgi:hypothetical protein
LNGARICTQVAEKEQNLKKKAEDMSFCIHHPAD